MAQRILRGAPATLTFEYLDADGVPTAAVGTMTVRVQRADGTDVLASGTSTTSPSTGLYQVSVPSSSTTTLDLLTATWTDSANTAGARTTEHEIVGGYLFSVSDVRAFDDSLDDIDAIPNAAIIAARLEVETEAEWICDVAFTPHYARITLDGGGGPDLVAGVQQVRTVRSCRILSSAGSSSYTSLTSAQLAGLVVTKDGQIRRTDGGVFPDGLGNIVVEVEHGFTAPKSDMRTAALQRIRDLLSNPLSSVPARATKYVQPDGFGYDFTDRDEFSTGLSEVDAVYQRYSRRSNDKGQSKPASRPWNLDPSWYGIFNGGMR